MTSTVKIDAEWADLPHFKLLTTVALEEGYDSVYDMLEALVTDSAVPAVCTSCFGATGDEVEPDAARYVCPECEMPTVFSPLVLAELI